MSSAPSATLLRDVRVLPLSDTTAPGRPVDVLVRDGVVARMGPHLDSAGAGSVLHGEGRWVAPGLWDSHVHLTQWALNRTWLDLRAARGVDDALRRLQEHLARGVVRHAVVLGWGHRSATWKPPPTVSALDAVCPQLPVVLVSGDGHHGWLNSAALERFGIGPREAVVEEAEWFGVTARVRDASASAGDDRALVAAAVAEANARGVVGVVDFEMAGTLTDWPARICAGIDTLRVRVGVYPDDLDTAFATGLHHGMPLPGCRGLATLGPLKIISDGSLNTRTAYCFEPYAGAAEPARGRRNLSVERMHELMAAAHAHGMECAVHAIGDAAVADALEVFGAVGARGSIEHAQLVRWQDVPVMGRLGLRASVQPAHLLDDRDVTAHCWPGRAHRCFALRRLWDAGVALALGSDAPVSPLDPWLAMAAAVHRSADAREPWHPEQALTAREAFRASTDGQATVSVGGVGDLVLLDDDPFTAGSTAEQAARLRTTRVAATVVAGRVVHSRL